MSFTSANFQKKIFQIKSLMIQATKTSPFQLQTIPEIMAVTKHVPQKFIYPLLECGHKIFGESTVQEALEKWIPLKKQFKNIQLHMIGPIQTNKLQKALKIFDVIHTLDRIRLAEKLFVLSKKNIFIPPLFIQINTGSEKNKTSIYPQDADTFIQYCYYSLKLPIVGFMCIPPINESAAVHFAYLKHLSYKYQLPSLSMGMSADYIIAAQFGATIVRIGRALFQQN